MVTGKNGTVTRTRDDRDALFRAEKFQNTNKNRKKKNESKPNETDDNNDGRPRVSGDEILERDCRVHLNRPAIFVGFDTQIYNIQLGWRLTQPPLRRRPRRRPRWWGCKEGP